MSNRPFLKWPGGKYRIVSFIKKYLPSGQRLIEPFVGSGAVFLNTDYPSYLLADNNIDLINLYQCLKKEGYSFIKYCRQFFKPENNTAERYYELRLRFNTTDNIYEKSALFLYLNRHGYNGLVRYNSAGEFNVPFGQYARPYFPEKEMLCFWEKSQTAEFMYCDFRETLAMASPGDVVYCDPPYVPLSNTASFTEYCPGGFGKREQMILAEKAKQLTDREIPVLISNHDTEFTRNLYAPAQIYSLNVPRSISCDAKTRSKVCELLALFC